MDQTESQVRMPAVQVAAQPSADGRANEPNHRPPKELGVLLLVDGILGLLLPGPVGTPFLIVGGVILWPAAFNRLETCLERRLPRTHKLGMVQINRFVSDLERRYPWPK